MKLYGISQDQIYKRIKKKKKKKVKIGKYIKISKRDLEKAYTHHYMELLKEPYSVNL